MAEADGLAQQTELYGAPLADTVRRVTGTLGLSQSRVAKVIGMSAPMLSQLVTGSRVKIGSPRSLARLQSLVQLCDDVDRGLAHELLESRLEEISTQALDTLTRPASRLPPTSPAASVQQLLRAVASGRELRAAAAALSVEHPDLADVLLVYGTGDEAAATAHFRAATGT